MEGCELLGWDYLDVTDCQFHLQKWHFLFILKCALYAVDLYLDMK